MNLQRIVILGGVLVGLAALVAGAANVGSSGAPVGPTAPPSVAEVSGDELAAQIARLHDRLRPDVAPSRPTRNLFQFASSRVTRPVDPRTVQPAAAPVAAAAPAATPAWDLIGLAERAATDGTVERTAILSGAGGLRLVKVGEAVGDGYRVRAIGDDAVELSAAGDAPALRLTLK